MTEVYFSYYVYRQIMVRVETWLYRDAEQPGCQQSPLSGVLLITKAREELESCAGLSPLCSHSDTTYQVYSCHLA